MLSLMLVAATFAAVSAVELHIDASTVLHAANPLYMGCHSDSGFVHEVTGWSSQMLFGESFERPPNTTAPGQSSYAWQNVVDSTIAARATVNLDPISNFSGWPSQKISIAAGSGAGSAGVANRGLGNEGLYLKKGMEYEGYFFASSSAPVTLEVRLETTDRKVVLASQQIQHKPPSASGPVESNPGYVQHTFSLTPSEGADCVAIAPGSDPTVHCTSNPGTAHICVKCGAQFTVAAVAAEGASAEVNVAFVVLQPGEWGRFKGLNARKDVADTLATMGIKAIRLGGSFCSVTKENGAYYQWQRWTGPVWERPSIGAHWDSYGGNAYNLIGGWGPFEMIDYAVALGAEPVITTTMTSTPDEFADLIEYCWANTTTVMGRKRVADGHPEPYPLRFIELGNEQYNHDYIAQVTAMEKRANEIGAAGQLHYVFPSNGGVTGDDVKAAAELNLGNRLVTDLHVGAGGALPVAEGLFAAHAAAGLTDDAAVNFETNAATHTHGRALAEAADLNAFFNAGNSRVLVRTASFCHGRSGHYDMFDQAISFFLPNMTWLQPPGHVHAMITASWQPNVLNATVGPTHGPAPTWATIADKALTCSSSEYQGDVGVTDEAGCLAAAQKKEGVNYAVWQVNKHCYLCSIPGDPSSWSLNPDKGAVTFEGRNVVPPMSFSAQQSDDRKTVVARVVNPSGTAVTASITIDGFSAGRASAVSLASDNLTGENTPSNVENISPQPLTATVTAGVVQVNLLANSYSVVTIVA